MKHCNVNKMADSHCMA